MFRLARLRVPSQGRAVVGIRLGPSPSLARPTNPAPFQLAVQKLSTNRPRPAHTTTPRLYVADQPVVARTWSVAQRPTTPRFTSHQRRAYNYHPNRDRKPSSFDPFEHQVRLQAARPLINWRGWRALNTPSTYTVILTAAAAALIFYFANLETVPVSGRTRFNVYSPERVRKAGELEHRRLRAELDDRGVRILGDWDPRVARVKRVMGRLVPFSGMQGEEWEVYVVDEPGVANAFVLPGGKVYVFSGILGLARSDDALATVLGHEIAHNLADHHGERLSQDVGASIALWSLVVLGGAFGLGPLIAHFVGSRVLDVAFGFPMSRLQESEADYIGLMMMAEACYDPREAVAFWARMERATGQEVPEWMSTHPANLSRIKKIQQWLPQAMKKRAQSDCSSTTSFADLFRQALRSGQIVVVG